MRPDSNRSPEARCSRVGRLQAQTTNTASDGRAPSAFDPSREYSKDEAAPFWQPQHILAVVPSSFVVHGESYFCAEQYMMVEKARLLKT